MPQACAPVPPLTRPPSQAQAPRAAGGAARADMGVLSPQISLLLALGGATVGILIVLVYCVYECPGMNSATGDYMTRRRLLEYLAEAGQ